MSIIAAVGDDTSAHTTVQIIRETGADIFGGFVEATTDGVLILASMEDPNSRIYLEAKPGMMIITGHEAQKAYDKTLQAEEKPREVAGV